MWLSKKHADCVRRRIRLLDPATTGMLLAIRRGLIEETGAATASEMLLIELAVIAFANAMRVQSMVGNTALLIEAEMFGQPSLRARWNDAHGRDALPDEDAAARSE